MYRFLVLTLFSLLFLQTAMPLAVLADAPSPTATTILTIDDAWKIALERNKDIQGALEFRNQVKGRYVQERAAALPQVTISSSVTRNRDESQTPLFGVPEQKNRVTEAELSQVLFTWGQVGAAIRAAKFGIATAEDLLRMARQAALRDVSSSFYDILLAREFYRIALQNLEQRLAHLDEARKKHALGVATDFDVLAAEVAVENARPGVIRGENLILKARDNLTFLLGLSGQEVDVTGDLLAVLNPEPPYGQLLDRARKRRPELSEVRNRIELSKELVTVADGADKPRLDLKASTGWHHFILGEEQSFGKTWSVGVFATYPIFDGLRARGQVAQAKSELSTRRIEEAKLLDNIALDVRTALNAVRESTGIVQALSGTVTEAERLLNMAQKGYEYGVKTRLEVEDAQLNLNQARGNLAEARRNYLVARITLDWATGILGEQP